MRVGVPTESAPGELRIALVPEVIARLSSGGFEVLVERGAGDSASVPDDAFEEAGARLVDDPYGEVEAVVKVQTPDETEVERLREEQVLIGFLQPLTDAAGIERLAARGVTAFAMESIPRITRAQPMDALSSQATVAGYKATLLAAERLPRFFPLLITAAGTIAPARVLVLGAGVAGLQAIATARRLGAVVYAYDVRPAVKEEVQSLGATFIELPLETQEGEGGYAREQSEEFLRKQRELIGEHIAKSDVVITTAAVPGRRAPLLVTSDMVKAMRAGSVVVGGVAIVGTRNVPSTMPLTTSQLFARNVANLLLHLVKNGALALDFEDEITKGACVTHGGEIVNERAKQMVSAA